MNKKSSLFQRRSGAEDGYSIVELLVVLAIIGLIAGIALPRVLGYLGSARVQTAKTQISSIDSALELYFLDNSVYPTDDQGLSALVKAPVGAIQWRGPYLKNANALNDPWGRPYIYKAEREGPLLTSLGLDGEPGGDGEDQDIANK